MTEAADRAALLAAGTELLNCEALYLDEQRWKDWISLYQEDCIFWAPAWKTDTELTNDHIREISIFYFKSRAGLEDRVWRIESGEAPSLNPLPRTTHTISNSVLEVMGQSSSSNSSAISPNFQPSSLNCLDTHDTHSHAAWARTISRISRRIVKTS